MLITQSQFENYIRSITGNPTYTLTASQIGIFSYYNSLYFEQLSSIQADNYPMFNFTNSTRIRNYNIDYCRLEYLRTPLWKSWTIEKLDIKTNTVKPLTEFKDYNINITNINGINYLTGIDFHCLSCNCECEKIKIVGSFGIEFPDILLNLVMNIIYNNLGSGTLGGGDCCANIKSKSADGFSVTYYDKPNTTNGASAILYKQADNILSYPVISRFVNQYLKKFIVI